MNLTKIFFSLLFVASFLFTPLILVIVIWKTIDVTYQTSTLATLLFTISLFLVLYIFHKITNETIELWKDKNINKVDKWIQNKNPIDLSIFILMPLIIPLSAISIPFLLLFLIQFLFEFYINFLFKDKYNRYLQEKKEDDDKDKKKENEKEYFKSKNFEIKEDKWKEIILPFSEYHKKTSLSLIKKNNLENTLEWKFEEANMLNIFNLKSKIIMLQTLQEVLIDIREDEKEKVQENNKEIKKTLTLETHLSQLIFQAKFIQSNMSFIVPIRFLYKLFIAFIILIYFAWASSAILGYFNSTKGFIGQVIVSDIYIFIFGMTLLIAVTPLSYLYFTFVRFYSLQSYTTKHNSWIVFTKNIFLSLTTFSLSILLTIISIVILSKSGLEYHHAFHFFATMILPTTTLQDIPSLIASNFKDDIVFGIFIIKLFFLLFVFTLGLLFIRQIIEIYVEKSDNSKNIAYSIPSDFARFFAYLILSVFFIILLYGTVFINYPALQDEYDECKDFLRPSQQYLQKGQNSITKQYCTDLMNNEENHLGEKDNTLSPKYCSKNNDNNMSSLYVDCCNYLDYNSSKFAITDNYHRQYNTNHTLGVNHCYTIMRYYNVDKNGSIKKSNNQAKRTLADYLPLSIFLALFGVVTMIASKHLLENYFSGLSLRINPNYEEGERVRIDGGEMLVVKDIGFRATTFYSIHSNTEIVMPHQQLSKSIIANYTKPTLDYRKKITIYIPDKMKYKRNIPKEAEKILLLAAFIATGVKKPRLFTRGTKNNKMEDELIGLIQAFKKHLDDKISKNDTNKIIKDKEDKNSSKNNKMNNIMEECEKPQESDKDYYAHESIYKIWQFLNNNGIPKEGKTKEIIKKENLIRSKLFLFNIYKLIHEVNKDKNTSEEYKEKKKHIKVVEKMFASIVKVLYDYETHASNNLHHSVDEYCMKRKIFTLYNLNENNKPMQKYRSQLSDMAKQLVDLSYYYFMLSKQIWELKNIDKSNHQKNNYDEASTEILDVPRVTSTHKIDIDGAYWEVTLLVTVELGEQSDEVVHHINMYIDDLWDIFDLPSRYGEEDNKYFASRKSNR